MIRKAMVLAAGYGSRMRPLTDHTPKPLLKVGNRCLIDYSLQMLSRAGIKEVCINLHYLPDLIEAYVGRGQRYGLDVHFFREPEILGTGGAIRNASDFFGNDDFIVVNADVITDLDLSAVADYHLTRGGLATMVVLSTPSLPDRNEIAVSSEQRVLSVLGVPRLPHAKTTRIYTGIQYLTRRVFEYLPEGSSSIIESFYQPALLAGESINAYLFDGYWVDSGSPESYNQLLSSPPPVS
ncbi:MAG: nucleotidyltransferase family protein [Bacteroidetes bacterium]|nr:nucleotidyltransferase family protein [Bacteroidota bacterium]